MSPILEWGVIFDISSFPPDPTTQILKPLDRRTATPGRCALLSRIGDQHECLCISGAPSSIGCSKAISLTMVRKDQHTRPTVYQLRIRHSNCPSLDNAVFSPRFCQAFAARLRALREIRMHNIFETSPACDQAAPGRES